MAVPTCYGVNNWWLSPLVIVFRADHAGLDTGNCIVVGEARHLICTFGVEDLIIVQTPDATLVCDRRKASSVKALVELLRSRGYDAHL